MKLNDAIDMKGRLTIRMSDEKGQLVQEISANNAIVRSGRDLVAKLFVGIGGAAAISHLAVGTGTSEPVAGDEALGTEAERVPLLPFDVDTHLVPETGGRMKVLLSAELPPESEIANITEAGLFNSDGADPENDTMYNRVIFPAITKTANFKLTFVWEVIF